MSLLRFFLIIAIPALSLYLLGLGSDLFIPFLIAIVIWYLIISITSAIGRIEIGGWKIPYGIALLLSICIGGAAIYTIFTLFTRNIADIINVLPWYQQRAVYLINKISLSLGLEKPPNTSNILNKEQLVSFASGIAQTVTSIAGNMGIILIYVLFLLLERETFDKKLSAIIKDQEHLARTQKVIKRVSTQIQSYIRVKTFVSVITAVSSYIVMHFVGVDFAPFWAQLIFFLNYIPTIGSIIATILPCLLTILQFDSWYPFIIVSVTLTTIQFFMGNILEPRLIGKTVNLSGLVIILSLAVWSKIWGITGMFLCVPIMVMLNIIFAQFEKTRWIAIMLSSNGDVES